MILDLPMLRLRAEFCPSNHVRPLKTSVNSPLDGAYAEWCGPDGQIWRQAGVLVRNRMAIMPQLV